MRMAIEVHLGSFDGSPNVGLGSPHPAIDHADPVGDDEPALGYEPFVQDDGVGRPCPSTNDDGVARSVTRDEGDFPMALASCGRSRERER